MMTEIDTSTSGLELAVVPHTALVEITGEITVDIVTKIEADIADTLILTGIARMGMMTKVVEVPETSQ
jgi:hypothetical protein